MYNRQLDAFINAADEGSFNKAAEKMYITTSALIQQVTLLEKHLNVKLLNRTSRGVTLTPEGSLVYSNAQRIIRISDETQEAVKELHNTTKDVIRVLRTPTARYRYFSQYAQMMEKEDPNVEFRYVGVSNGGDNSYVPGIYPSSLFDVSEGIYMNPLEPVADFIKLFDTPICAALPKNHPLFADSIIDLPALAVRPVVMFSPGMSDQFDRIRKILGQVPNVHIIDINGIYTAETYRMCIELGYALLTPAIWQDIYPDLSLRVLSITETVPYGIAFYKPVTPAADKLKKLIEREQKI